MFKQAAVFNGQDGLWVTDGTDSGTHELTKIVGAYSGGDAPSAPHSAGLHALEITAFNGKFLFNGLNDHGQSGLWVSDGTSAGTHELTGISGAQSIAYSFYNGFAPNELSVFNNTVLFSARNQNGVVGLWVTDGT